jgi:CubicO group peptidase (beta-lactamase class C family)
MTHRLAAWLLLTLLLSPEGAHAVPRRLLGERMEAARMEGEIAGAVTIVATADTIIHLEATGFADLARKQPMATDAIFWIASMTKPITGVAILMLQEEGKLNLDDDVTIFLPEFKALRTPSGRTAHLTLRQMLTHTSGLSDAPAPAALVAETLADLMPFYLAAPMQFEPGTRWKYCQAGLDTAARVVEIVSGEAFDRFLERRMFGPLGMKDTTFYLTQAQVPRLATAYAKDKTTAALEPVRIRILGERSLVARNRPPLGSGGLFSTATDYARFCQMLLNDGTLEGRRFLKAETVQSMHTVQTDGIEGVFPPVKGYSWGISCGIISEPQGVTAMFSPGTFGHSGAYGTHAWIDPQRHAVFILMVQRTNFSTTDDNVVRRAFQQSAVEAFDRDHPGQTAVSGNDTVLPAGRR